MIDTFNYPIHAVVASFERRYQQMEVVMLLQTLGQVHKSRPQESYGGHADRQLAHLHVPFKYNAVVGLAWLRLLTQSRKI